MLYRRQRARSAPMALLALCACAPTDAELRITDPDGLATEEQLAWVAEQFERFTALTGPDRIGLDEIRVVPGRYEEGMEGFVFGRYIRRGGARWVELTEDVLINRGEVVVRHELCHALDDREGFSRRHREHFDDADHAFPTRYHLPEDYPEMEVFALLCHDGPPAAFDVYGDQRCDLGLEAWAHVLHDEVFLGRPDLWTEPGPAVEMTTRWWEPLPGGAGPEHRAFIDGGLMQLTWVEDGEGGWERLLIQQRDEAFTSTPVPEPWDEEAVALWSGVDGDIWMVTRDALIPLSPEGTFGAPLPRSDAVPANDAHAILLGDARVLVRETGLSGDPGYSRVYNYETGEVLLELERIGGDRRGFHVLDGEVWATTEGRIGVGLARLTDAGWSLQPGPSGGSFPVRHHGALLTLWSPSFWLNEDGEVGGLATLHEDGSWTPMGSQPCDAVWPPGQLIDTGEQLLVYDWLENRFGELELDW